MSEIKKKQGADRRQNYWSSIMFMSADKRQSVARRQSVDRRWQTVYPRGESKERRFVVKHRTRISTRTYIERRGE
jgi:hypothetical protein